MYRIRKKTLSELITHVAISIAQIPQSAQSTNSCTRLTLKTDDSTCLRGRTAMRANTRGSWAGRLVGKVVVILVAVVAMPGSAKAQLPGAPTLPGGPIPTALPGATTGVATATPAATGATGATGGPSNIWSFFMKTPAQKAQIKACICGSPIGQFLNNMMMPAGLMTGGMLGPFCPGPNTPNPADMGQSPTSAQGAAAKIKAEEAQAKAKIAALEYLGTVDCRYYPEAEAALIAGLRAEKNECVRLAAAKALASGCCCSAKIVKALTICVDCSTKDGFPAEASELVRAYAYVALERCLRKCIEAEPDTPPELPPTVKKAIYESLAPAGTDQEYTVAILLAGYYSPDSKETTSHVFVSARQSLSKGLQLSPKAAARLSGPRNVRDSLFPGPGRTLSVAQPANPPRKVTQPDTQQLTTISTETIESEQATAAATSQTAEKKPGRGNMLNILQDAFKR
jgi:hypothetical protein